MVAVAVVVVMVMAVVTLSRHGQWPQRRQSLSSVAVFPPELPRSSSPGLNFFLPPSQRGMVVAVQQLFGGSVRLGVPENFIDARYAAIQPVRH